MNIRYGNIPRLEVLAAQLERAEREACCWALARHLRGVHNPIADAGSRDNAFAGRWSQDPFRDVCLKEPIMRDVVNVC